MDARERGVRQPLLQHERPRPVEVRADAGLPGLHRPAGQHRAGPHQRRHSGRRHAGLVHRPSKHGDHDIKFGAQYQYSRRGNTEPGQPERHVRVRPQQRAVQRRRSRAPIPTASPIRVGGPSTFFEKAHYFSAFAQDKWRFNQRLTLSLGAALRPRDHPDPRDRRSAGRRAIRSTRTTFQPRVGVTYDLGGGKSVVRGGYGRFYDKTHFELIGGFYTGTPFTIVVHGELPDGGCRSRAAQRPVPDRSVSGQRPDDQPRAARTRCIPADSCCATPARAGTIRIAGRRTPIR